MTYLLHEKTADGCTCGDTFGPDWYGHLLNRTTAGVVLIEITSPTTAVESERPQFARCLICGEGVRMTVDQCPTCGARSRPAPATGPLNRRDLAGETMQTDEPTVLNPEAVGDPAQTPIVHIPGLDAPCDECSYDAQEFFRTGRYVTMFACAEHEAGYGLRSVKGDR